MKIRFKIILVVLPVVVLTLCLAQAASYFSARNGITRVAQAFLSFKVSELEKYAESQWNLLTENDFSGRPDMVEAAKNAVLIYARSIILSDTEVILALDENGNTAMASSSLETTESEKLRVMEILKEENQGIFHAVLGGEQRVFAAFILPPSAGTCSSPRKPLPFTGTRTGYAFRPL